MAGRYWRLAVYSVSARSAIDRQGLLKGRPPSQECLLAVTAAVTARCFMARPRSQRIRRLRSRVVSPIQGGNGVATTRWL